MRSRSGSLNTSVPLMLASSIALQGTATSLGLLASLGALASLRSRRRPISWRPVETLDGRAVVASAAELASCQRWSTAFATQRKDARYFEIVQETIVQGFDYWYLILEDAAGTVRAVQPFFLLDQDLLAGTTGVAIKAVAFARKMVPRLLLARTLMLGCAAGEGHLDGASGDDLAWVARQIHSAIKHVARQARCGFVVLKEFHADHRDALAPFAADGFARVPSLPMTRLNIDYPTFDDYMTKALGKVTRKGLRRKFRDAEAADPITLQIVGDVTPFVDEVYPLYLAVYNRSNLHFEKLTPQFMCALGRRMADKARFFIWRQNGKSIAFSLCLVNGDTIYDEYLGLDYSIALDLHLYFYTFRDIVQWAMREGYKWYASSALNYDPKLHFKCELVPLDLYVAHTWSIVNRVLKHVLPRLEPTRRDKTLKQFANYADLWGAR